MDIVTGFAHHLVGIHTHLHTPDWRALSGSQIPGAFPPATAAFFHHQHAAFPFHALERHSGPLTRTEGT